MFARVNAVYLERISCSAVSGSFCPVRKGPQHVANSLPPQGQLISSPQNLIPISDLKELNPHLIQEMQDFLYPYETTNLEIEPVKQGTVHATTHDPTIRDRLRSMVAAYDQELMGGLIAFHSYQIVIATIKHSLECFFEHEGHPS